MGRRVVVTGMGLVSALGNDLASSWEALLAGTPGVGPITRFDARAFDTRIAAEVKGFDPLIWIEKKETRRQDLFTQYAMATSIMAMDHSGIDMSRRHHRLGDRRNRNARRAEPTLPGRRSLQDQPFLHPDDDP